VTRTLLLDADLLAYHASAANQRSYDWNGDGNKSVAADELPARRFAEEKIEKLADKLKADEVIVCLSDDFNSFRKDRVDPTYKANRNEVERPVHLYDIKDYLAETYDTVRWTALEADDVMGILATDPTRTDERIIVSQDKDMMSVPGKLYRPPIWLQGRLVRKGQLMDISVDEADRFHLYQTLVGDATDGYKGAPGIGPEMAKKLLDGHHFHSWTHTFRSGPRKGLEEVRWALSDGPSSDHRRNPWKSVVSGFARFGLTEADAIKQARLARILRYEDWDGRSPRLWNPPLAR
jgi:DNA polymerase-1